MNPLEKYFPVIHSIYPEVSIDSIEFYADGHDHDVFLLPNGIAFRFLREKVYEEKDKVETMFLQDFSIQSPIPLQIFTEHRDEGLDIYFQTYKFIFGKGFSQEIANMFSKEERLSIAKQLGQFLKLLHSYPLEKAHVMHMDELDPKDYYAFFQDILPKNRETIYPLLSQSEKEWCDRLFADYLATKDPLFIPCVTNNDLLPEHIIVDDHKHILNGIIDFALRIADPARDFMFMHVYGEDFLQTAIKAYGEVDAQFMKRRKFYGGNFYIMYLYNAITRDSDSLAIEKHKQALSKYIAENPIV